MVDVITEHRNVVDQN